MSSIDCIVVEALADYWVMDKCDRVFRRFRNPDFEVPFESYFGFYLLRKYWYARLARLRPGGGPVGLHRRYYSLTRVDDRERRPVIVNRSPFGVAALKVYRPVRSPVPIGAARRRRRR